MRPVVVLWACTACSSLAEHSGHDVALPNAEAGPFREIGLQELGAGRAAPYALNDDDHFARHLSVIDTDGDIATLDTWAYAAHTVFPEGTEPDPGALPNEIVRYVSLDARSFGRSPEVVFVPEQAWEMGTVDRPALVGHAGELWLYYAAAGGIGAARGDGRTFTRVADAPVLAPAGGWEDGAVPTSPSVIVHPDGTLHMYYEVALADGPAIGEARSSDGITWERSDGPILGPSQQAGGAAAPSALVAVSPEGRTIEYLYYGVPGDEEASIGMAARFGGAGSFQLANAPVFGGSRLPTEPCVLRYDGFTLLFVTQKAGSTEALDYPAVAVGVAPANITLPPRDPP